MYAIILLYLVFKLRLVVLGSLASGLLGGNKRRPLLDDDAFRPRGSTCGAIDLDHQRAAVRHRYAALNVLMRDAALNVLVRDAVLNVLGRDAFLNVLVRVAFFHMLVH